MFPPLIVVILCHRHQDQVSWKGATESCTQTVTRFFGGSDSILPNESNIIVCKYENGQIQIKQMFFENGQMCTTLSNGKIMANLVENDQLSENGGIEHWKSKYYPFSNVYYGI